MLEVVPEYNHKVEACNFGKLKRFFSLYHAVWVLR